MTSFQYFADRVPEGQFLCALCFEGKPADQAWTDSLGQRWDKCLPCSVSEHEAMEKELPRLRADLAATQARGAQIEARAREFVTHQDPAAFNALAEALEGGER